MPSIKKVRNWNEYNKSLEKRGEIIFVIAEEYYEKLYFQGEQRRGGAVRYNKEMYEFIITIKATFRLALRQSVGCARGILRRMFGASLVPNYGHVSRKVKELEFEIKRYTDEKDKLVICFDSTGVSIHSVDGIKESMVARS